MFNKQSYIILTLGLMGCAGFFLLRPYTDFNAGGPISESKVYVEGKIDELSQKLGFSTDSLAVATFRQQYNSYLTKLKDSLNGKMTPYLINKGRAHTQGWVSVIGERKSINGGELSFMSLFRAKGRLLVAYANDGRVMRIYEHEKNSNPTFVQGDSLQSVASAIVNDYLGYPLINYELSNGNLYSDSANAQDEVALQIINPNDSVPANENEIDLLWKRKSMATSGPLFLSLSLEPVVREFDTPSGFGTKFGYQINKFIARDEYEPEELIASPENNENIFAIALIIAGIMLGVLVFVISFQNIFRGKVEWGRVLVLFIAIALGMYLWRSIFYWNTYNPFFNGSGMFLSTLNNALLSVILGLYAAFAYIGWEALARSQRNGQLEIVDAFWQRKFFIREFGYSLVIGLAFSGILLGVFGLIVKLQGLYFFQIDSQFGFAEASITPKIFTININAWKTSWIVGFAQIGLIYGLMHHWIKNKAIATIMGLIIIAGFLAVLGRVIGTSGSLFQDFMIYAGLAAVVVYAYQEFGIVTVNTAWWGFVSVLFIMPYLNSKSLELASVVWAQSVIILIPLLYGFIAYRFGAPLSTIGDYTPEYEERIAQHLRVEREIEIARESQYKLMPLQPPKADGFDVYGFFLPSFEVGGDYFDYILSTNGSGEPEALTMTVVDVSGKAMRAAMPAIFTSGLLLSRMKIEFPAQILSEVTETLFYRTDKRTFITCALARYDLKSRKMSVANAGHCRPVLKRNGVAEFIQTPAPRYPLGIRPDTQYKAQEFILKKGDFFLLYSDGLPEAANEEGKRFGFDEVPRLVERIDTDNLSAAEIALEIKRTVQKFSNYQLNDDTTVICLKV